MPWTRAPHICVEPSNSTSIALDNPLNMLAALQTFAQGGSSIGTKASVTATKLSMASSCAAARRMLTVESVPGRCMVRLATIRDEYKAMSAFAIGYS